MTCTSNKLSIYPKEHCRLEETWKFSRENPCCHCKQELWARQLSTENKDVSLSSFISAHLIPNMHTLASLQIYPLFLH